MGGRTDAPSGQELLVDFIVSLDGYASGEGWPGWWGLEGPEYLSWLEQQPESEHTLLMGANTYRAMSVCRILLRPGKRASQLTRQPV